MRRMMNVVVMCCVENKTVLKAPMDPNGFNRTKVGQKWGRI